METLKDIDKPTDKVFEYTKEKAIEVWKANRNENNDLFIDTRIKVIQSIENEPSLVGYNVIIDLYNVAIREKIGKELKDCKKAYEYFNYYKKEALYKVKFSDAPPKLIDGDGRTLIINKKYIHVKKLPELLEKLKKEITNSVFDWDRFLVYSEEQSIYTDEDIQEARCLIINDDVYDEIYNVYDYGWGLIEYKRLCIAVEGFRRYSKYSPTGLRIRFLSSYESKKRKKDIDTIIK